MKKSRKMRSSSKNTPMKKPLKSLIYKGLQDHRTPTPSPKIFFLHTYRPPPKIYPEYVFMVVIVIYDVCCVPNRLRIRNLNFCHNEIDQDCVCCSIPRLSPQGNLLVQKMFACSKNVFFKKMFVTVAQNMFSQKLGNYLLYF